MRARIGRAGALFSYVDVEARIPAQHPLRAMRRLTNAALAELDERFSALYEGIGRPPIPPERLLRMQLPYVRSLGGGSWRLAKTNHYGSIETPLGEEARPERRLVMRIAPRVAASAGQDSP